MSWHIKPRIPSTGEALWFDICGQSIGQSSCTNDNLIPGEDDPVEVIDLRIRSRSAEDVHGLSHARRGLVLQLDIRFSLLTLYLEQCDDTQSAECRRSAPEEIGIRIFRRNPYLTIRQDYLNPIYSGIKEAVSKRAALAGCPGKSSPDRDTWKLHHDERDQASSQSGLDKMVHGNIGFDQHGLSFAIGAYNMI
ncbi:hypothetical protein IFM46972_00967 [Aspergillus udagawae]|uniref:Uncharacterized protein n=1 Tax=Aspergillus udagawae TaxID=91492 RepID=A0A8H3N424_9EURO|nr:hypothetical protein IFM46972_00967 [Aspergillus udagawae]